MKETFFCFLMKLFSSLTHGLIFPTDPGRHGVCFSAQDEFWPKRKHNCICIGFAYTVVCICKVQLHALTNLTISSLHAFHVMREYKRKHREPGHYKVLSPWQLRLVFVFTSPVDKCRQRICRRVRDLKSRLPSLTLLIFGFSGKNVRLFSQKRNF